MRIAEFVVLNGLFMITMYLIYSLPLGLGAQFVTAIILIIGFIMMLYNFMFFKILTSG